MIIEINFMGTIQSEVCFFMSIGTNQLKEMLHLNESTS
ncbi:hypothetical protein CSB66_0988 [Enterobacter hormaechei]|nr:hypothetical protein CSB66_0988 [Enterobacter hormaechei]